MEYENRSIKEEYSASYSVWTEAQRLESDAVVTCFVYRWVRFKCASDQESTTRMAWQRDSTASMFHSIYVQIQLLDNEINEIAYLYEM